MVYITQLQGYFIFSEQMEREDMFYTWSSIFTMFRDGINSAEHRFKSGFLDNASVEMHFILMNPSKANEQDSDNTLEKCAGVAFNSLPHLEIGVISIVNVYPFYESSASNLKNVLQDVKSKSKEFYYK